MELGGSWAARSAAAGGAACLTARQPCRQEAGVPGAGGVSLCQPQNVEPTPRQHTARVC